MRIARLHCEGHGAPVGIAAAASAGALDLLQLDYPRPRLAAVARGALAEIPELAIGFSDSLKAVVKSLFLEPQLRVIASAGWADAYACVEGAAGVLVEGGCSDLPVAAVRGSNLLPILEMLQADGVDLRNAETGAPWRELREPLLAADLQLGAGPLATALQEEARVIVAGCYDGAAPAVAAVATEFGWSWRELDRLALAAMSAHAATWIDWQALAAGEVEPMRQPNVVELAGAEGCTLDVPTGGPEAASRLQQWLRDFDASSPPSLHADVRCDFSQATCTASGPRQLTLQGAKGAATDGCWRLEVLYQAGFAAETMIEFAAATDDVWRRRLGEAARLGLAPERDAGGLLTVAELQPLGGAGGGWLHLAYQSKSRAACQQFAEQTVRLVAAHRPRLRLATGSPAVHLHCGLWSIRVPRDAVDVAVETRLAREWI